MKQENTQSKSTSSLFKGPNQLNTFAEVLLLEWRSDTLGYQQYRIQPVTQFIVNYFRVSSTTKFDSCNIIFGRPDSVYVVHSLYDQLPNRKQIIWIKTLYKGVYNETKATTVMDYVFAFNPKDSTLDHIVIDMGDLESSVELYDSSP
ncbi:MAG: hypothetical protein JNJ85_02260 [Candidatus Kapabacteria bacterium]|nr:hypothetical protein [Candidatus Kapabacteria bacterium]